MMFLRFLVLDIQKLYWTAVIKIKKFFSFNEQYRSQLAAHEAGHTVTVLCTENMHFLESVIDVDNLNGRCNFWIDVDKDKTQTIVEQMTVCLGGLAGELITNHKLEESSVSDIKAFFQFKKLLVDWRTAIPSTKLIPPAQCLSLKLCVKFLDKNNVQDDCTQDDIECFQFFLSVALDQCHQHQPLLNNIINHLNQHDQFTVENL